MTEADQATEAPQGTDVRLMFDRIARIYDPLNAIMSVSLSRRRICRNTGPWWIEAPSSHAWSARTAHLALARA
jgi:hypothetical protein